MTSIEDLMKKKIDDKYTIMPGKQIGSGSFGVVYLGVDETTDECVAIKIEESKGYHSTLAYESKILSLMQGKPGIPKKYYYGEIEGFHVMAIDMLGPSLEDLFNLCDRKFSLKTVLIIAYQLLTRLEVFHQKGFIHRDIKPENCLIGLGKKANIVHLIDYGLSKKYKDQRTGQHIPYRENKSLVGTARYASLNSHLGMEQSRRDDLQSIGYMFIYFLKGMLPWQGQKAIDRTEKYTKIMEKKMLTASEILCKGLPVQFSLYFNYVNALQYEDKPDYSFLRKMFQQLFQQKHYKLDYMYDWCVNPDLGECENESVRVYEKKTQNNRTLKIVINTAIPETGDQLLQYDEGDHKAEPPNEMLESQYNNEDLGPANTNKEKKDNETIMEENQLENQSDKEQLKDAEEQQKADELSRKSKKSQKNQQSKKSIPDATSRKDGQSNKNIEEDRQQQDQQQNQPEQSLFD